MKTRNYITELTYRRLHESLRDKYDQFIAEESLVVMDGAVLDMMAVYDELDRYISQNEYDKLTQLDRRRDIMSLALKIILLVASIILTVSILLQSSNSAGLSGSIGGGAEQLFGKKRSSGYDAILSKISTVTAVLFIVLSLILVAIE